MKSKRKILVTGGCGFIGRSIVNALADLGHEVHVVDPSPERFREDVTFYNLSITSKEEFIASCQGMDSIIHNASLVHTKQNRGKLVWEVNYQGSLNVMEACRVHHIPRLVYISTGSAVYEGNDIEYGNESLPYSSISQAPYTDSKIKAEKEILAFNGTAGTLCCALRPHVVFGPGDTRFVPAILEKARTGKLKREFGNRGKLADFTYVTNLSDAVVLAEEKLIPGSAVCGQAYFITNGEPMAYWDFFEKFIVKLGYPPITKKVPVWLVYAVAAIREGWDTLKGGTLNAEGGLSRFAIKYLITHHYFNISKAKRDLSWHPRVSIEEGIVLTVAELKKNGIQL